MGTLWKVLTRKKILDPVSSEESRLGRILNTFDLTALGVGSTLGVGVYVLVGHVAKDIAGPSVVLSFLIATIASVFAGLCYAEFGARTPRAGSAYIYSYVCVGEFVAFIIGWNLILEYVIGSASVARGLSLYLDTLLNNTLRDTFVDVAPMHVKYMSEYFDFFAFAVSLLLAVALAFGLKESSMANNIFTIMNLGVVLFVVIAGSLKADTKNWHLPANHSSNGSMSNATTSDHGGFFPFGVEGMIKGAATCFYGFVGFDCIATTGEEVKNPRKAIPLSIILSLFIIFLAYFGTSTVVTLMLPYYDQNPDAPLPYAFHTVGWDWAKWVVAIGGICGLCASLFGAMFPLPRIIYAMASDHIIFNFLGIISERFKTPVIGTLLAGLLTGLMAALFELSQLVHMMSIGTLLAYTIVAASVLLLRYTENSGINNEPEDNDGIDLSNVSEMSTRWWRHIFNCSSSTAPPSKTSQRIVSFQVCFYSILCLLIGLCAIYLKEPMANGEIWPIVLTAIVVCGAALCLISIASQPKSRKELSFKVPFVPLVPALSILINIYLMLMLDVNTWIRFAVWMAIGLPIYYFTVKNHPHARNKTGLSTPHATSNGVHATKNGITNHAYCHDDDHDDDKNNDGIRQQPNDSSAKQRIESEIIEEISELHDYLEQFETNEFGAGDDSRQLSLDSNTSNFVHREENVQADVHRSPSIVLHEPIVAHQPSSPPPSVHVTNQSHLQSSQPVASIRNSLRVPEEPIVATPPPVIQDSVFPELANNAPLPIAQPTNRNASSNNSEPITSQNANLAEKEPITVERSQNLNPAIKIIEPIKLEASKETIPQEQPAPSPGVVVSPQDHSIFNVKLKPATKRKAPDIPKASKIPDPPPPPPNNVDSNKPKVQINFFTPPKLKHVTFEPKKEDEHHSDAEESRRTSQENIKFGSEEFIEFKHRLAGNLRDSFIRVILPRTIKQEVAPKPAEPPEVNENVIEESVDREQVKEKLTKFLEANQNNEIVPPKSPIKREWKTVDLGNPEEDKENHRKHMQNIFGTIKLRKVDSFKIDTNETSEAKPNGEIQTTLNSNNTPNELIQHKLNMAGNFNSIKLRKVDSFKKD